ncbi:MAG: histidine phosphatase family protein [Rhodocyclaceae bacterium]|nr:histidine phosphatase family protein [Rhodocyclaceae bacterium]
MTEGKWRIPPPLLSLLERAPDDRAVAILLRHSVRDHLPEGDAGYVLPITDIGRQLALELGGLLRGRLRTLHASPLVRCVQTAQALAEGAGANVDVIPNRLLGDPGVFVLDGRRAWANWEQLGHEGVMRHLVTEAVALSGMARPDEAARFLVQSMLATTANRPGVHVFVTHDSLVTATAARLLDKPLGLDDWPGYLEGAFFWTAEDGIHSAYRDDEAVHPGPLCSLAENDVIEFARREIAATVGFDTGARFFLAGGAFKSLLTGCPPRDLDLWASSEHDRVLLIDALRARGARSAGPRMFAEAFEVAGRVVEVPHKTEPDTLTGRLAHFDIGLSAVGVEHRPDGEWSVTVHPIALESAGRREVLLLKPLVNWKYALTTLERMRRYAVELGFSVPHEEEAEVWRVFESQDADLRKGLMERYRRTGSGGFGIMEEVALRFQ